MALTKPSSVATQPNRQNEPHIPKLTYRTNSTDVGSNRDSISTTSTAFSPPSTVPTSPGLSTSSSMPSTRPLPSPRLPSDASNAGSSQYARSPSVSTTAAASKSQAKSSKEKKGGSFFGFLSVKEPSAQAFEDYQNAMRKKRGRATVVGMPGVSSAKLPPTVPKVNSKWDGVPQAAKEREKGRNNQRLSVSASVRSQGDDGIAGRAPTPRSRAGTGNSSGSGNKMADIYGWHTASSSSSSVAKDFALEHVKPQKTTSTTTLPETTLFPTHPPLPIRCASEQPPPPPNALAICTTPPPMPELPATPAPLPELSGIPSGRVELHGVSAPLPELPGPLSSGRSELAAPSADGIKYSGYPRTQYRLQELESPVSPTNRQFADFPFPRNDLRPHQVPELQGDALSDAPPPAYHDSPCPTPPERSPITPGFWVDSPPLQSFSYPWCDPSTKDGLKTTVLSIPHNPEEVILRSTGVNVLPPPTYARRQSQQGPPQRQSFVEGETEELSVPNRSEPQLHSILKWDSTSKKRRPSVAKAFTSPASLTAASLTAASPNAIPARDRHLGGSKASPMSRGGSPQSEKETERSITPTPDGGAQSLRKMGRMKFFHK